MCTIFARNWQLPFLIQRKGKNDRIKYFMINLYKKMLQDSTAREPVTSWSPVARASDWVTKLAQRHDNQVILRWKKERFYSVWYIPSLRHTKILMSKLHCNKVTLPQWVVQCSSQTVPLHHWRIFTCFGTEKISSCTIPAQQYWPQTRCDWSLLFAVQFKSLLIGTGIIQNALKL